MFSIQTASAEDSAGILECLASAFAPFRENYTREAFLDTVLTPGTIQQRLHEMTVFVAMNTDGLVVGTIACKKEGDGIGHLRGMAVRREWQGSSVASALLARAEEEMHSLGCSTVTLDTTEPLRRAVRFYEKNGFRPTGRVTNFFGMPLFEYQKLLLR